MFPAAPTTGRFDISRVIQRAVAVLARNAVAFITLAVLFYGAPYSAVTAAGALLERAGPVASALSVRGPTLGLAIVAVAVVGTGLLQAAVIHATVCDLNGRPAAFGEWLSTSLRLALPLVGASLLVGLLEALGLMLLIVPGVLVALAFSVAIPALVVERRGISAALQRSRDLTRNHRSMIFLLLLILGGLWWIGQLAEVGLSALATSFLGSLPYGVAGSSVVISALVGSLTTLVQAVGAASLYFELRSIKEGADPAALAAVFD